MRTRQRTGFTLVEILIVVVILGILAAIVVPQFTSASNDAIKGALQTQLSTINTQIELYRVRNNEWPNEYTAVAADALGGANDNGWGVMIAQDYLKEEPVNGFTNQTTVVVGADALIDGDASNANGWVFVDALDTIYAVGYDPQTNTLSGETGYVAHTPSSD